jgi:transcriptional regulator with XRE-family HTH domain
MNYKDYYKKLDEDSAYKEAELDFKVILDLADDILRLRMERGWSQAELAERVGTKQANISRLEGGLSNPSVNFLQKVAKALDTSISIKFENTPSPKIVATTDTKDQSIHVPNWPVGKNFQYYPSASTSEKL